MFQLIKRPFTLALGLTSLQLLACSAGGDGGGGSTTKNNGGNSSSTGGSGPDLNPTAGTLNSLGGLSPGGGAANAECGTVLPVTFRDFKGYAEAGGHPDFEASARPVMQNGQTIKFEGWNDIGCGLVEPSLGADGKPLAYTGAPDKDAAMPEVPLGAGKQQRQVAGPGCWTEQNPNPPGDCELRGCIPWKITPPTYSIQGSTTFNQWFNTVASVNMEIAGELPLMFDEASGSSIFDTNAFFPLDNQGFGNTPGQQHNYHFTTEIHVKFKYEAGQTFTFRGDDDLWIFINGKLALDVGGQHQALLGKIVFDEQAAALGITPGNSYPMDIFHAERQTTASNFRIQTNIKCFEPVVK